jgi:hypothetical protein
MVAPAVDVPTVVITPPEPIYVPAPAPEPILVREPVLAPEPFEEPIVVLREDIAPPEPIVIKPRRQPTPIAVEAVESVEPEPFSLWYEQDLPMEPVEDTADRLWTELDRIELPFEGEPHDLWWSETHR